MNTQVVLATILIGEKILSVSRKDDHKDLGFTGGKLTKAKRH